MRNGEVINTMIGVVLWKNIDDGSAVIWCEDQGDLAFSNNKDTTLDTEAFFDVGDVVEFDVLVLQNMRGARNICRLQDYPARPALTENLRGPDVKTAPESAEIIQFRGPKDHAKISKQTLPSRGRLA